MVRRGKMDPRDYLIRDARAEYDSTREELIFQHANKFRLHPQRGFLSITNLSLMITLNLLLIRETPKQRDQF